MSYPYSGPTLIQRLIAQHEKKHPGLLKQGIFSLNWRTKVGSFPHPDVETLVGAGEPCGRWNPQEGRAEDKRQIADNWNFLHELPLNGYIPAASIRGLVRSWAKKQSPELQERMEQFLGVQCNRKITAGKVTFLDAFPEKPTRLSLDITNPQQGFQVYHNGQSTPISQYTLGSGWDDSIKVQIAIRGIPGQITPDDLDEVWSWVQKAIHSQGLGGRTAAGYGAVTVPDRSIQSLNPALPPGYSQKILFFSVYSQGNAGPNPTTMEFRPSHWRGWLRSWLLRFFLGVMSRPNAEMTVNELMGSIEPQTIQGAIRLKVLRGEYWGEKSDKTPHFHTWSGRLQITAPTDLLKTIIIPILRIAVMLGGVGRGSRRPLHIFEMSDKKGNRWDSTRGCHVFFKHSVKDESSGIESLKPFGLVLRSEDWQKTYQRWSTTIENDYPTRFNRREADSNAEIVSPSTCAIYLVPGPEREPIDFHNQDWEFTDRFKTRGEGMALIYELTYKRNEDVGGNAGGGSAHCSWVSIKRITRPQICQEVVCLFLGHDSQLRLRFLEDLANIEGSTFIFGQEPQQ